MTELQGARSDAQGHHLETTRVTQEIAAPFLEMMCASCLVEDARPRAKREVVSIRPQQGCQCGASRACWSAYVLLRMREISFAAICEGVTPFMVPCWKVWTVSAEHADDI